MSEKPEALRLADELDRDARHETFCEAELYKAAQMLRLQHAGNMGLLADNERLTAEVERLREELRQSGIDHTRAEVERLKGLLRDWREFSWSYRPEDWRVRINEALQEPPR